MLFDEEILTEEEFTSKKKKLLEQMQIKGEERCQVIKKTKVIVKPVTKKS